MARANRKPPGLLFVIGTTILAAYVGLGIEAVAQNNWWRTLIISSNRILRQSRQ